jgi:hypothetical protein
LAVSERDSHGVTFNFDLVSLFVDGNGFSGKGGLGTCKVIRIKHTQIRWHTVTKIKDDDVTGNDQISCHFGVFSITDDNGITRKHSLQSLGSLLSRTFLNDSDGGIDPAVPRASY